jgi:tRNA dimethylallyltransferase
LAIALAQELHGEVINADAMQLYRGMDIGTAKLGESERAGVPHHQFDVLDVTETASVAVYQREAREVLERLLAEGKTPIVVGGSGLYIRAVFDELEFPGTDPTIRDRLLAEVDERGPEAMHVRLAEVDPIAAAAILPSNGRRIARALEVQELTGRPFSATMPVPGPARYGAVLVGLDRDADELDRRVDQRVVAMFAGGLVEETETLLARGLRDGKTASRALGYQQVVAALDGAYDLDTAMVETARATRRFVRRQRSWFRRDQRVQWHDAAGESLLDDVLRSLHSEP